MKSSNDGIKWDSRTMTYITKVNFLKALENWQKIVERPDHQELFEELTGVKIWRGSKGENQFLMISVESYKKLHNMLGPHHHVLISAHIARLEDEK